MIGVLKGGRLVPEKDPSEEGSSDDLPELEEMDIRGDLGGIRELIRDYIIHAENGGLTPECSHNGRIVIP